MADQVEMNAGNSNQQYEQLPQQYEPVGGEIAEQQQGVVVNNMNIAAVEDAHIAVNNFERSMQGYYDRKFSAKHEIVTIGITVCVVIGFLAEGLMNYMWIHNNFDECTGFTKTWYGVASFLVTWMNMTMVFLGFCSKPNVHRRTNFSRIIFLITYALSLIWFMVGISKIKDSSNDCNLKDISIIPGIFMTISFVYIIFSHYITSKKFDDIENNIDVDQQNVTNIVRTITQRPDLVHLIREALIQQQVNQGA